MEVEHLLVPSSHRFHFAVLLVANHVVDVEKFGHGNETIEHLSLWVVGEARQEGPTVGRLSVCVDTLDEGVDRVTVRLDGGDDHFAVLIFHNFGLADTCRTPTHGLLVDAGRIIHCERHILDAVTMLGVVRRELLMVRIQWRREYKGELVVAHDVRAKLSRLGLQSLRRYNPTKHEIRSKAKSKQTTYLVCHIFEAHSRRVERRGLLGVAHPEPNVVEAKEFTDFRLYI